MSVESAFEAYRTGNMNKHPGDRAEYVARVKAGLVQLPEGKTLLPQDVDGTQAPVESGAQAPVEGEVQAPVEGGEQTPVESGVGKFVSDIGESITGAKRRVPATEAMDSVWNMPELSLLSVEGLSNLIGTAFTNPEETKKTIKSNSPDVKVTKDEKGNLVFRSAIDGKDYAIKPGLRPVDVLRGATQSLAWATATAVGPFKGILGAAFKAGGMQALVETSQEILGGQFDWEQVPLAVVEQLFGEAASKVPGIVKGARRPASQLQEGVKAAEKLGVSPKTSDVFPKKKSTLQESRVGAVRSMLSEYGATAEAQASDTVLAELLKKRGSQLKKYVDMKTEVIDRLSSNVMVNVDKTNKTIGEEIAKLQSLRTKDAKKAVDVFMDYGDALQNNNLGNIEELRKQLGTKLKDPDLATIRGTAEKSLSKIYKSLREDMGAFIKANGESRDFIKWKVANKRLSDSVGELKINVLKRALDKGEATPEMVKNMIFSKKPSEIRVLTRNLTPEGRRAAQVAILEEAATKSGGIDAISPNKFLANMNRLSKSTGVFFTKEDKKAVEGLKKALEITKSAEAPPRSVGVNPNISLLSLVNPASLWKSVMAAGAKSGLGIAYNSKPVRNILIQLAKAEPGKEVALMKALTAAIQTHRNVKKPFTKDKK